MRIISGKLKGKLINFVSNSITRPLKDSVKENIFNVLKHSNYINVKIEGANILDLYSGIGSFGIECISRGAKKITFIEKDLNCFNTLEANIKRLSISDQALAYNNKIEDVKLENNLSRYRIFFFDPPYADKEFIKILDLIKKKKIFERNHIVIIHREKNSNDCLENLIEIKIIKKYGRSKIIFGNFI